MPLTRYLTVLFLTCAFGVGTAANAQSVIRSPVAVLQNTGGSFGPGFSIRNTLDQSGLLTNFVSGVTSFDTYLAARPLHSYFSDDYEWFSRQGAQSSTIIYDLGGLFRIDRVALWNEEYAGVQNVVLESSTAANFAASINLGSFAVQDNPDGADYAAQVLQLTPATGRYIRATVSGSNTGFLGIGEIAFSTRSSGNQIPEPGTLALIGITVIGPSTRLRRKRQ